MFLGDLIHKDPRLYLLLIIMSMKPVIAILLISFIPLHVFFLYQKLKIITFFQPIIF